MMGDRVQGLWKTAMRFAQVARASSGSIPAVPQYCTDTRQVSACHWELRSCNRRNGFPSACHCEERSDGTIRIPCGRAKQCANTSGEYGEAADLPWADVVACADTRQVTACHCEERSDVAIRTPCSSTKRKAILKANTEKCYGFARSSTNLSGFSAGKRIAAPVCALVRNDMQKTEALLRLQGCVSQ